MTRRHIAAVCLVAVAVLSAAATGQDRQQLERQLQSDYVGKVWLIRGFYEGGDLRFDNDGKLLKGGKPSSWTLAGVEISSLRLDPGRLDIKGKRVAYAYEAEHRSFKHVYRVGNVKIALETPAMADESSIRRTLERTLLKDNPVNTSELLDYWQAFLNDLTGDPEKARVPSATLNPDNGERVFKPRETTTPPRPVYTPDPKYSEPAQQARYQGVVILSTVIEKTGDTGAVRIMRPLGFGLDEQAIETVKTWRFQPAERNGEPVATQMNIQIAFRLY